MAEPKINEGQTKLTVIYTWNVVKSYEIINKSTSLNSRSKKENTLLTTKYILDSKFAYSHIIVQVYFFLNTFVYQILLMNSVEIRQMSSVICLISPGIF